MGYEQIFSRLMEEKPDINSQLDQAKQLAQTISAYQKEQRTAPVIKALQEQSSLYNSTTDEAKRAAANAMNNRIRSNYLEGGGSPSELPSNLWGSDPTSGFQTMGGYDAPITGYEGLKRKDIIDWKRQAAMDALTKRVQESNITGIDPATNNKTWDRQYQEAALARSSSGGGGGGMTTLTDKLMTRASYSGELSNYIGKLDKLAEAQGSQLYADNFSTEYGTLAPVQAVEQDINRRRGELYAQGIDPDQLVDDVYKAEYGMNREDYWKQADRAVGNVSLGK